MSAILHRSLLLPLILLSACRPPDTVEVTAETSRGLFRDEPEPVETGGPQRFPANSTQSMLQWTTPGTWQPAPAREFRDINFTFGPDSEGECYLTVLNASGGGSLENFNRWRGQFGLAPMTAEDAAALPVKPFLGRTVPVLDISGEYSGGPMSGGGAKKDWRLAGAIMQAPGALITVKLTGPKALVEAEMKNFDAFLASIVPAPR